MSPDPPPIGPRAPGAGHGQGSILGSDPRAAADPAGRPVAWVNGRPRGRFGLPAALIWLAFIVFPLIDAVTNREPVAAHLLSIAAAALFVGGYVWLVFHAFGARQTRVSQAVGAGVVVIAVLLTLLDRPSWGVLFTYCAACAAVIVAPRRSFPAVLGLAGVAAVCCAVGGGGAGSAFGYGASTIGVGLLMVLMRDLRIRNAELVEARAELARAAVAEERERFARDLHDLLGHTLSVIALKAELAGKLISASPERAAREVADVEDVARQALGEVRLAVSGYHQPTLDGELAGARLALSAAGIEADVIRPELSLSPELEGVLAWAIREGATNVIRHSAARHCTVRVTAAHGEARAEILDDGDGCPRGAGGNGGSRAAGAGAGAEAEAGAGPRADEAPVGHGIPGLGERAEAVGGRVQAATRPEGGFRLAVTVPVPDRDPGRPVLERAR